MTEARTNSWLQTLPKKLLRERMAVDMNRALLVNLDGEDIRVVSSLHQTQCWPCYRKFNRRQIKMINFNDFPEICYQIIMEN